MLKKASSTRHVWQSQSPVALIALLSIVFFIGGGSRADIASLVLLRPMAALAAGAALLTLTKDQLRRYRTAMTLALASVALALLYLVPLPPVIWHAMPGRGLLADIDTASGLGSVWRPATMTVAASWNAALSLLVPFAVLLFGIQLGRGHDRSVVICLCILILGSGMLGAMQFASGPDGGFYFYRITNPGFAVGLFANRNHAGVMLALMIPLVAAIAPSAASRGRGRQQGLIAIVATVALVLPLVIVTGSRAALLLTGVATLISPFLLDAARRHGTSKARFSRLAAVGIPAAVAVVLIGVIGLAASRAPSLSRLLGSDPLDDQRRQIWELTWTAIPRYLPFGSGPGSFPDVYQIAEPYTALSPNYVNHAHNDFLEILLTTGLAGGLLVAMAMTAVLIAARRAWRTPPDTETVTDWQERKFARLGSIILLLLGLASCFDYPLRVPSVMCVAVIAAVWLCNARNRPETGMSAGSKSGRVEC